LVHTGGCRAYLQASSPGGTACGKHSASNDRALGSMEREMERTQSRDHIHVSNTFGHVAADRIASGMGSWTFIIAHTVIIIIWVALNLIGFINHWDPYPFILLNLLFSTQAAYSAPIIMMSQNRQAQKDTCETIMRPRR
jgi:uncharacterized membrane protein